MKLWLLKLREDFEFSDPDAKHYVVPYTNNHGFVIRSESEDGAREMASKFQDYVRSEWWLDPDATTCVEIPIDGAAEIILADEPTG